MDEKYEENRKYARCNVLDESIYAREKRVQLLDNDELSYEEEGFMSGYSDMEEFEEIDRLSDDSEGFFGGEL